MQSNIEFCDLEQKSEKEEEDFDKDPRDDIVMTLKKMMMKKMKIGGCLKKMRTIPKTSTKHMKLEMNFVF